VTERPHLQPILYFTGQALCGLIVRGYPLDQVPDEAARLALQTCIALSNHLEDEQRAEVAAAKAGLEDEDEGEGF